VFGGYFVWLTLPEGVDAGMLATRAEVEEQLVVAPGSLFEVSGDEAAARFPRNVRLTFSWEDEENLVEGVRRLGSVLGRLLRGESAQPASERRGEAEADGFK
jgi:DNA-binding transcriptional MocR family regulator